MLKLSDFLRFSASTRRLDETLSVLRFWHNGHLSRYVGRFIALPDNELAVVYCFVVNGVQLALTADELVCGDFAFDVLPKAPIRDEFFEVAEYLGKHNSISF